MRKGFEKIDLGYQARVCDLEPWHVIRAKCFSCERTATVDPDVIKRKLPGYEWVSNIRQHLRCTHCGNRNMNFCEVYKAPRNL